VERGPKGKNDIAPSFYLRYRNAWAIPYSSGRNNTGRETMLTHRRQTEKLSSGWVMLFADNERNDHYGNPPSPLVFTDAMRMRRKSWLILVTLLRAPVPGMMNSLFLRFGKH